MTVLKFSPAGKVQMVIGRSPEEPESPLLRTAIYSSRMRDDPSQGESTMVQKQCMGRLAAFWALLLTFALATFAQQTAAVGKVLTLNGIDMYYESSGQGQPLVLLHGFGGSGATWANIVPEFVNGYQVIVPDLRGHGRSTNPSKQFTHRQSALDVYALLLAEQRAVTSRAASLTLLRWLLTLSGGQEPRLSSIDSQGGRSFSETQKNL